MISLQTKGESLIPSEVNVGFKYCQLDNLADRLFLKKFKRIIVRD